MKKLYIINYNEKNLTRGFDWGWHKNMEEVEHIYRMLNIIDIYEIPQAIRKQDIINSIQRYIIKPLNK